MNLSTLADDQITLVAILIVIGFLFGLLRFFRELFLGRNDPLMTNIQARVEAGRPADQVAREAEEWRNRRLRIFLISLLAIVIAAVVFAPNATNAIVLTIWNGILGIVRTFLESISGLVASQR